MTIQLNGKDRSFEGDSLSIDEMLEQLELKGHPVLVELNGEALLRSEFPGNQIKDGDTVEVVRMVAGG